MDGARDISAVFCVKIQIGGKFLGERLFQLFTMASARFATFSTQEIEKIVENKDSENTKKSTEQRGFQRIFEREKLVRTKRTARISEMLDYFLSRSNRLIQWGH